MNNSSMETSDTFEGQNFLCRVNQSFCITFGIVLECLSVVGLLFNGSIIMLFLKCGYCKKDNALILSLNLLVCDCLHLSIVIIHIAPELIVANVDKPWDIYDLLTNLAVFYVWLAYKCFSTTAFVVITKKFAYFLNSIISGSVLAIMNQDVRSDFLVVVFRRPKPMTSSKTLS
uniref:G-protein coupled receptors family 1 profile domain-containing protein n=1 Tax=Romanomermis culicivorax TaxID=13658 RepID=A0A915HRL4_ROMCU